MVLFPNGQGVGEKIFKTGGFEKTFEDAQQICTQAGGQLASPRSAAENEALQQLVVTQNKAAFLSMNDIKTEGNFTYPTGESLVYSNWAPGEPNNNGGAENCVEIYTNGKWNDKSCSEQRLVICEFWATWGGWAVCDPGAWPVSQVSDLCAANIAIKADASPGQGFSTEP